jgi:protein TonB
VIAGSTADASLLQNRTFRRLLVASVLGHVGLTVLLTFGSWHLLPRPEPLEVVYVSELPAAALPAPSQPKPAPARQQVAEVVIPRRPQPKPKPPAAKPPPAPAKPEPKPVEAQPTPTPEPAKPSPSASALLDKLREEAKSRPQGVPEGQGTGERAGILDAERAAYIRKVQAAIEPHWVASACFRQRTAPLWTVEISASGQASEVDLNRSSGDRHCDDSAERAIAKAQPLPPPPAGIRVLDINFEELR